MNVSRIDSQKRDAQRRVLQKESELNKLLSQGIQQGDTMRASDKRALDKQIEAAQEALAQAKLTALEEEERLDAIARARESVPGVGDTHPRSNGRSWPSVDGDSAYRPDKAASFFADVVHARNDPQAMERLQANQREQMEKRDVTTSDPGAAGFIPPLYLGERWAELPRASRPFADIVPSMPLPDGGTSVSVPKVQSGTSVAVQTAENAAISETDIDTQSVTASLVTIAGMNDVSLQSLERSFPGLDQIIFRDLQAAHDAQLDAQLLNGSGSAGQHLGIRNVSGKLAVSYTDGTPTGAEMLPKVYDAIQQVASNRYLNANVIVMHPRRAAWLSKELSSTFPLFQQGQLTQAIGQQQGGFVSSFGGLRVVLDPNILTNLGAGTNEDEVYVLHADDLLLMEGPVQFVRFDDVLSGNLTVRLRLHSFSFFVASRQPKSIAAISGTGLAGASF